MRANFFGDFTYYAEIDNNLFELEDSYMFDRSVQRYKSSYCCIGKDFLHPDKKINPCVKMNFSQGAHLIKITMHHVRPHIGITNIRVRDDDGNEILSGELLPNDIFTYNIKIKRDIPFNLFLTISSVEITHALVRTLIETNESNFDDELSIDLNKSTWVVKDTCIQQLQDLGEIQYGTEYKY